MRKIFVNLTVKLEIDADEDVEVSEIIDNLDYSFVSDPNNSDVIDTEIIDYDIIDSK
jgi:isocitrate/isopropylmalate dehydrogenase